MILSLKLSAAEWQLERGKTAQAITSLETFAFFADRADGEAGNVLAHQARQVIEQLR
ncbi:FIMAH domain-containing protein [Glycomyces tenuis]|uniref:FIMAH domain-containing protein n=1 Tax=Glycomyces tenuis TaxID=58116 RepID=UPI003CCBCCE0